MQNKQAALASRKSTEMFNIGGRPATVPDTIKSDSGRAHSVKLALAFVAIYIIWGSTYLAIRYAVETIPPLVTAGIRHSIAGLIMFAWAWARGFRPTRSNWISGAIIGALFFLIGHGSLHWAEQYVGSGLAALLIATEPMFIVVLAWALTSASAGRDSAKGNSGTSTKQSGVGKKRSGVRKGVRKKISTLSLLGLGLGVLGVALLTGAELTVKGSSLLGLLAILGGSFSWSLGVVISPKLDLPTDALGRTALPTLCGAAMLLAAAGVTGEFHATHWVSITAKSLYGLAYLIVFGSLVAFTSYTWLLQRCSAALVSTHTYANPVVAVFLGWLLASEPITLRVVMASVAILAAIMLIRQGERVAKTPAPAPLPAELQTGECA